MKQTPQTSEVITVTYQKEKSSFTSLG